MARLLQFPGRSNGCTPERLTLRVNAGVAYSFYTDNKIDEHPDFVAYARDLASTLRQTIFVDQVGAMIQYRLFLTHVRLRTTLRVGGLQCNYSRNTSVKI